LASYRPFGKVTQLAEKYKVTRQAIYPVAARGKAVLDQEMEPGPHGAKVNPKMVCVDREHVERSKWMLCLL
jgi:hypothetical protein